MERPRGEIAQRGSGQRKAHGESLHLRPKRERAVMRKPLLANEIQDLPHGCGRMPHSPPRAKK